MEQFKDQMMEKNGLQLIHKMMLKVCMVILIFHTFQLLIKVEEGKNLLDTSVLTELEIHGVILNAFH